MTLRDDLEECMRDLASGEYSDKRAYSLIRDHGPALLEAVDKGAMWDMCNRTFVEGDVEVRCHIIVGLNEWENGHWNGYTTCSPAELKALTEEAREGEKG